MLRGATADEEWRIQFDGFEILWGEGECREDGILTVIGSNCATGYFPTANQGVREIPRF